MRRMSLVCAALMLAAPAHAQTVEAIVAKALAARGGVAKLRAVRTVRLTGTISFGEGAAGPFVVEMARTGRMREEITLHGKHDTQITNGHEGWALSVGPGTHELRALGAGELKNMAGGADFDGPLLDSKAKGFTVRLAGSAPVEGHPCWLLEVTGPDGDVRRDYIDQRTFLERKWEGNLSKGGSEVGFESYFRDYRPAGGVMWAHRVDSDRPGQPGGQRIVFDRVEVNVGLDDGRFARPGDSPADTIGR